MLAFIYSNRTLLTLLGVVLFLIIVIQILKKLPTKASKKKSKDNKNKEIIPEQKEQKQKIVPEKKEIDENVEIEEKTQNKEENSKKDSKKPKIVQIYKRDSRVQPDEKPKAIDPIYDRAVEFVNTSKNIAKFKSFAKEESKTDEDIVDDFGFVIDEQEGCEFCEDKVKHFDHSKRMSAIMKDGSTDELFSSHISDKYLNINSDNHLKLDEVFNKKLFEKTEQMMKNSSEKLKSNSVESVTPRYSLWESDQIASQEEVDFNDDVRIDTKTALIADTYFNRRKKK